MYNDGITSVNPKDIINSGIAIDLNVVRTTLGLSLRGIIIVFCRRKNKLVSIQREICVLHEKIIVGSYEK